MKKFFVSVILVILFIFLAKRGDALFSQKAWYYPTWAVNAEYNTPIKVLDTESALGRYATKTKELTLKDMALIHGHLCDGLVISYIEIKAVLQKLFPDGKIDRTDIRVVSKNGPCWVDAVAMMTGARTNFGTLSIQPEIGDGFIIQKISTGEAYDVHLKDGVFPKEQAMLENKIRTAIKKGQEISPKDVDEVEKMQDLLSKKLLNSPPKEILIIKKLENYDYKFRFQTNKRGDIGNKNVAR